MTSKMKRKNKNERWKEKTKRKKEKWKEKLSTIELPGVKSSTYWFLCSKLRCIFCFGHRGGLKVGTFFYPTWYTNEQTFLFSRRTLTTSMKQLKAGWYCSQLSDLIKVGNTPFAYLLILFNKILLFCFFLVWGSL